MSQSKHIRPYGFWDSALTGDTLATGSLRLGAPILWGEMVLWTQSVPFEKGRTTLMACRENGEPQSLLPAPWDIRSKAHEYGGGAYVLSGNTFYFVNASDQNIYAYKLKKGSNSVDPVAITKNTQIRYADLKVANGWGDENKTASAQWLYAVAEDMSEKCAQPKPSIVAINTQTQQVYTLAEGADFYAGLAINPTPDNNQHKLAFITWQHPSMPWDETTLWELEWTAGDESSTQLTCVRSPSNASIVQPEFSPQGELFYISDEYNGWWNLCQAKHTETGYESELVLSLAADFATPQWTFGMKNWGFLDAQTILCSYSQNGAWSLAKVDLSEKQPAQPLTDIKKGHIETVFNTFSDFYCQNQKAVFLAAGFNQPPTPAYYSEVPEERYRLEEPCQSETHYPIENNTGDKVKVKPKAQIRAIAEQNSKSSSESHPTLDSALTNAATRDNLSKPQSRYFTSNDGNCVHFWLYMPCSSSFKAPNDSKPPVIVLGHGGPTGATDPSFNLKIQFWTQRGFAVADVNYRGSTGFGRKYRQALQRSWGIKDVEDLCGVANHLVALGEVHPHGKFIKGSSAGGYSVLAALTMHDVFDGGVSLYGIANLHSLATDTHKFESHYLDGLIGPYPEEQQEYTNRSPINHIDKLNCPILIAQGLDDKVVPPSQAELIVEAAQKKGIPVTYLPFEGEGHGFRLPTTLKTLFEQELRFYQALLSKELPSKNC